MSQLHVTQLKAVLEKTFNGLIDLSDVNSASAEQKAQSFLTRALTAFAIMNIADTDPSTAAKAVTDGTKDNGIDGIYYDRNNRLLLLAQSKWHGDGHGSIERGDCQKFITGFRDLLNTRFDRFNKKIQAKQGELEQAMVEANMRIAMVLSYSGVEQIATEVAQDLDDLKREMNDPTELLSIRVLNQGDLYSMLTKGLRGDPISLEVVLYEWGSIKSPHSAVYGQVAATDVANWWKEYFPRILTPNLRLFLGETDVNQTLVDTLTVAPDRFWYYNNGITVLCDSFDKKALGGDSRDSGIFLCRNVSVVNGAQTAGAIARAVEEYGIDISKARVPIRFISLAGNSTDLGKKITEYTNTQNRIEKKDFVALDPEQDRLRTECKVQGVDYVYKSGETVPVGRTGCDLVEASVALACTQDEFKLAVQAKREIGKLWDDINTAPYKSLFNGGLTGDALWQAVQWLRQIDTELNVLMQSREKRDKLICVHGNRMIAWIAMKRHRKQLKPGSENKISTQVIAQAAADLTDAMNSLYPDAYPANLFKNVSKCEKLVNKVGV